MICITIKYETSAIKQFNVKIINTSQKSNVQGKDRK